MSQFGSAKQLRITLRRSAKESRVRQGSRLSACSSLLALGSSYRQAENHLLQPARKFPSADAAPDLCAARMVVRQATDLKQVARDRRFSQGIELGGYPDNSPSAEQRHSQRPCIRWHTGDALRRCSDLVRYLTSSAVPLRMAAYLFVSDTEPLSKPDSTQMRPPCISPLGAPSQLLSLAGLEHCRTIPLMCSIDTNLE